MVGQAVEEKSVQQMQAAGARLLQTTPGLAEKMVAASRTQPRPMAGGGRDERDAMIAELQRQLEGEKEKNRSLEDQYKYRVASFAKREMQTKNKIDSLEKRLNDGPDVDEHVQRMAVIQDMHGAVVSGLDSIQNNTAKILQDQEKELMRAFRAKLQEVSQEIESQRSRKGEDSTLLQARHKHTVAELHEAQELANTFDKKNQQLVAENQRLKEQLRTREDDRQALIRELVIAKKEAARLKAQSKEGSPAGGGEGPAAAEAEVLGEAAKPSRRSFSQRQLEQAKLQQTHNRQYEREVAYRDAIQKLKRAVEAERKQARALRQQVVQVMQNRTELEVLLRQCMDDVKAEIARQRSDSEKKEGTQLPALIQDRPPSEMSVHELNVQDRERVLELLLSQQRVVQLLYSKTFTQKAPSPGAEELPATPARSAKDDDFSWLSDIIPPEA